MKIDSYTIRARIVPAIYLVLPLIVMANYLLVKFEIADVFSFVFTNSTLFLIVFIMTALVRKAGKSIQRKLFVSWGGSPTSRFLRYNNPDEYNQLTKERIKEIIKKDFGWINLPSELEEKENPDKANLAYENIVNVLKALNRGSPYAKLVDEENANYGTMRNLCGLKPFGILVNAACVASIIVLRSLKPEVITTKEFLILIALFTAMGLIWIFCVTQKLVKIAADEYAKRLFETLLVSNREN